MALTFDQRELNLINSLTQFAQKNNIPLRTPEDIKKRFKLDDDSFGEYPIFIVDDILTYCIKSKLNFTLFNKPQNFENCSVENDSGNIDIIFNNIDPDLNPEECEYSVFSGFEYFSYTQKDSTYKEMEDDLFNFLNGIIF